MSRISRPFQGLPCRPPLEVQCTPTLVVNLFQEILHLTRIKKQTLKSHFQFQGFPPSQGNISSPTTSSNMLDTVDSPKIPGTDRTIIRNLDNFYMNTLNRTEDMESETGDFASKRRVTMAVPSVR